MNKSEILAVAKPILFNTEMVKAILEGRKTVTRRLLKQPFEVHPNGYITKPKGNERICPYEPPYQPGDILYVRETFCKWINGKHYFKADPIPMDKSIREDVKWRPSIHMPKEAARIFLKISDVRVERLQDITEEQAEKEGATKSPFTNPTMRFANTAMQVNSQAKYINGFKEIWYDTLPKQYTDNITYQGNPYVWVYEFERVNVDD